MPAHSEYTAPSTPPMLQVPENQKPDEQLLTPTPSRETSRARPGQKSAQPQGSQSIVVTDGPQQGEQPNQSVQHQTKTQDQLDERSSAVKRKRGRPRKRPLSPAPGQSQPQHVTVLHVPTPAQAEFLHQQSCTQGIPQLQAHPADVLVETLLGQNLEGSAAPAPNTPQVSAPTASSTPISTTTEGMVFSTQTIAHPAGAQYPPAQPSTDYPRIQSVSGYQPTSNLTLHIQASAARATPSPNVQAQLLPLLPLDAIEARTRPPSAHDNIENLSQNLDPAATASGNGANRFAKQPLVTSKVTPRKPRSRPSLETRENGGVSEEGKAAAQAESQAQADNVIDKSAEKATKARKDIGEGRPRRNNPPSPVQPDSLITDIALMNHEPVFRPQLRVRSLSLTDPEINPFDPNNPRPKPQSRPYKLPWHVTRWHELGFTTFPTGLINPLTGEPQHHVVVRTGEPDNSPEYWFNVALGVVAEKHGPHEEKGETVFGPIPEIASLLIRAREMEDMGKLARQRGWDALLDDVTSQAKAWKEQRRSKWEPVTWVMREVRARRLSRGDFVEEVEERRARSDVAVADGDEGDNGVIGRNDIGYCRERDGFGDHWMGWDEISPSILPGEVLRSRVAQVEMEDGGKTKIRMVYAGMQDLSRLHQQKDLDSLDALEDRLDGENMLFSKKAKLKKVLEQVECRLWRTEPTTPGSG